MRQDFAIIGLDLAWGERNGDGLCLLAATPAGARVVETAHVFGDAALLGWLAARLPPAPAAAMVLFDAPLLCPNAVGSRPVDRLTHTLFGRFHAGAHPANATRCPRPLRLAARLERELGFRIGWQHPRRARLAVETFPHPALVRWLRLARIVKYKRGPVAARRAEFARLQGLLRAWLPVGVPELSGSDALAETLAAPWTKPAEDRLDALVCALIGYWHWRDDGAHRGHRRRGERLHPPSGRLIARAIKVRPRSANFRRLAPAGAAACLPPLFLVCENLRNLRTTSGLSPPVQTSATSRGT